MAVYQVVTYPDPVLREKAKEITKITPSINRLIENMADTMYASGGIGLAAPQIGVSKRAVVVDLGDGLMVLINPEITKAEGRERGKEGCLSFPDMWGEVDRALSVKVRAFNLKGEEIFISAEGFLARALQHEIDHLDGIVFIDRAVKIEKD
ncbi:MAG: peptide deformylase [Eubacteriales bacterium]|nr:peptide deformylase [Bacillota bacterium]MBV1726445.1 peptide deformylase [Desulforudis sp.]MDP3051679.1 peptide deformylase [Eubacteriales bacterium]MDQ7788878.1 peptide deformylase [Clostridia bacterium]MBU4532615.1 peptide deformylase [Bacillota bacterium]